MLAEEIDDKKIEFTEFEPELLFLLRNLEISFKLWYYEP